MIWSSLTAPISLVDFFDRLVSSFLILSFMSLNPRRAFSGPWRSSRTKPTMDYWPMLSWSWYSLFFVDLIFQPKAGLFRTTMVIKDKARLRFFADVVLFFEFLFFVDLIPQPRAGLFRTIKVIKDKARPGFWIQGRRRWFECFWRWLDMLLNFSCLWYLVVVSKDGSAVTAAFGLLPCYPEDCDRE